MVDRISFNARAKALLILAFACAFLSIFATFDTSEHYRAWRTARHWTARQKATAPAEDADAMHAVILTALAVETAIIALSFACALMLGIAVATESASVYAAARWLGWIAISLGLLYAALMLGYRVMVGERILLKGPIFDYHLSLQVPILVSLVGYPLSFLLFVAHGRRHRVPEFED